MDRRIIGIIEEIKDELIELSQYIFQNYKVLS